MDTQKIERQTIVARDADRENCDQCDEVVYPLGRTAHNGLVFCSPACSKAWSADLDTGTPTPFWGLGDIEITDWSWLDFWRETRTLVVGVALGLVIAVPIIVLWMF